MHIMHNTMHIVWRDTIQQQQFPTDNQRNSNTPQWSTVYLDGLIQCSFHHPFRHSVNDGKDGRNHPSNIANIDCCWTICRPSCRY